MIPELNPVFKSLESNRVPVVCRGLFAGLLCPASPCLGYGFWSISSDELGFLCCKTFRQALPENLPFTSLFLLSSIFVLHKFPPTLLLSNFADFPLRTSYRTSREMSTGWTELFRLGGFCRERFFIVVWRRAHEKDTFFASAKLCSLRRWP